MGVDPRGPTGFNHVGAGGFRDDSGAFNRRRGVERGAIMDRDIAPCALRVKGHQRFGCTIAGGHLRARLDTAGAGDFDAEHVDQDLAVG